MNLSNVCALRAGKNQVIFHDHMKKRSHVLITPKFQLIFEEIIGIILSIILAVFL